MREVLERIEEARERRDVEGILFVIGIVLVLRGISELFGGSLGELMDCILLAMGIVLAGFGAPAIFYYDRQYRKLLDQLKTATTPPTCPRCGKEVAVSYAFCPFCGAQLKA